MTRWGEAIAIITTSSRSEKSLFNLKEGEKNARSHPSGHKTLSKCFNNVGRQWTNVNPTLIQRIVSAGKLRTPKHSDQNKKVSVGVSVIHRPVYILLYIQ